MCTSCPDVVLLSFGTYNPPTPTHLRIFEVARDYFKQINKSSVIVGIVVPISQESDEASEIVSLQHRRSMLDLALKSSNWIRLSEKNYNLDEPKATRNLLKYHQNVINNIISGSTSSQNIELPKWLPSSIRQVQEKVQVKLLGGADLFENHLGFNDERRKAELEEILQDHGLVVVSKNGTSCERIVFDSDLLAKYKTNIVLITNWGSSEVNSPLARRLISRKQSVKYLLDDSVIEYIRDNNLYAHYYDSNIEHKLPKSLPALKIKDTSPPPVEEDESYTLIEKPAPQGKIRKHPIDFNGDLSEFLKFAIETKRIKAVRKEQFFV